MKKLMLSLLLFFCLYDMCIAQTGKVGINTVSPLAMLHVQDSSVLFSGALDISQNPGTTSAQGTGVRMMWYPDKSAFRAGRAIDDKWDTGNIGMYSFAAGNGTRAKGRSSVALGENTSASGIHAMATGHYTDAAGDYSFTNGGSALATGYASRALGFFNLAAGSHATSIGAHSSATGDYSNALGYFANAEGVGAVALGYHTKASGDHTTAIGRGTKANGYGSLSAGLYNDPLVEVGYPLSESSPIFIIGNGNSSFTSNAMVLNYGGNMGLGVNIPAHRLHVKTSLQDNQLARFSSGGGYAEIVIDNELHQIDLGITNFGGYVGTKENVDFFIRTGTIRRLAINHENGYVGIGKNYPQHKLAVLDTVSNVGIANFSCNGGFGEIQVSNSTMMVDLGAENTHGYVGTKQAGDFGLRTAGQYKLFIKNQTGNVGIGLNNPQHKLAVRDTLSNVGIANFTNAGGFAEIQVSNTTMMVDLGTNNTNGYVGSKLAADFGLRTSGQYKLYIKDETGNIGIGTIYPNHKLDVNGTAAKPGGGSWTATSDARLKQDVSAYTDGLASILQLRPVSYRYNAASGYDTDKVHIGVIAQDLQPVAPYMVSTSSKVAEDGTSNYLEVDNSAMVYMLINAVKEQQAIITQLENRMAQLENN